MLRGWVSRSRSVSPGLCLIATGHLSLHCVTVTALAEPQRLSPVEQRGEFPGLQQEPRSGQGSWPWFTFPGALSLQTVAVACGSSISWLNRALTAAFLLSVISTGSTAQLHWFLSPWLKGETSLFPASLLFSVQLITTAGGIDLLIGQWFHLIDNKALDNLPAELKLSPAATGGLLVLLQQIVPCC